ncbi:MAG: hypothetical protein XU10_C0007G0009 [Chloroflexi bacterium CSP1-4]|nr:MAG: hypothetical protein XU10_C0007G0009 [Chloroflexi bacterium CSP1-4]
MGRAVGVVRDPVAGAVARLLMAGAIASVVLVAAGVVLMLAAGLRPTADSGPGPDPASIVADVVGLRPAGLLWAGLLLTVALPTARVALALAGFLRLGDRRASAVAAGVLGVLALAFAVALATS